MSQRLEAFREIADTMPAKRAVVFSAISSQGEQGATLDELVGLTGWRINRLSGRVSELRDAGYLAEAGKRGRQTIWVACLPQGAAATPRKARTVQARVDAVEDPDLFGRRRIIITIPSDIPVADIRPESFVGLKI